MTEYDYSPQAYEKYLATQARITSWVEATQRTNLVAPDFPPTPLGANGGVPLPYIKERKSHSSRPSPAPSPPPEQSKSSKSNKRSKSASTPRRVPTPFVPTQELPEPGCPIYHRNWDAEIPKAPHPLTPPSETLPPPVSRERKQHNPRSNLDWPTDFVPTPGLPEPGCPVYWPGNTVAEESYKPSHPANRKRSMSFSVAIGRPLDHSPPAPQHHNSSPPHNGHARGHESYWPSSNSSPNHSSGPLVALSHAPAPVPFYPVQNFSYPLPHQQYPDYDAARRREPVRSHTEPAHASHYSMDNAPYSYATPGHSRQRSRPTEPVYKHREQPQQRPRPSSGPVTTTETQSGSVRVTFPNGKTLYMTPPNSNRAEILSHPDQYQVPYSYYIPPKKPPLLKRLFNGFGKNNGGSSSSTTTKSTDFQSAQNSPARKSVRKRRSSFSL